MRNKENSWFSKSSTKIIYSEDAILFRYFLAQELIPGYLNGIEATYTPPKGYFVAQENPEGFAKYEAEFPYKEKLVLPGQLG